MMTPMPTCTCKHATCPVCLFAAGHVIEVRIEFVEGCWWSTQHVDGVETDCVVVLPPRKDQALHHIMTARGWEAVEAATDDGLDFCHP